MSKYNIIVEYRGNRVKVKCSDFDSLKSGVETKLSVTLSDHRLEYLDSERKEWIGILDDDDLEDASKQTQVRLIQQDRGKNI